MFKMNSFVVLKNMAKKLKTLLALLYDNYQAVPDKEWLFTYEGNSYKGYTYRDILKDAISMGLKLKEMGIKKNDQVALFSYNKLEWAIMDFALMFIEAVSVPFYHGLIGTELNKYMELVNIKMVCVNTPSQYKMIKDLPEDRKVKGPVIIFDEQAKVDSTDFHFSECLNDGHTLFKGQIEDYEKEIFNLNENHVLTLMFSSGTSARRPSPVKLTQKNLVTQIKELKDLVGDDITEKDRAMAFLPMSHILGRTGDLYSSLVMKQSIYFIPSMDTLIDYLPKVSPTMLVFVPRVLEKIHTAIHEKASPVLRSIIMFGIAWSTKFLNAKGLMKLWYLPLHLVFKIIIYRKIRAKIGKDLKFIISGGAPLTLKVETFFSCLGFTILAGYGLTETSPVVSVRTMKNNKLGTVGPLLESFDIHFEDDGEIWVRGDCVTPGYHNDAEAQKGHFTKDGWFKTGDLGKMDEDNNLIITGRKKDVIVLSNGKKCIPGDIEELLLSQDEVDQVCLIGDTHSYLVGVVIPSEKYRLILDNDRDSGLVGFEDKLQNVLKEYPNFMRVKNVVLSDTPFTYENGLLTYTQKVKRKSVAEHFKEELDKVYSQKRSIYVKED
ncbi:MAG: hypothetical protein CMP39_06700 [Rickettsiales bacterium]|nr:hypothetical protein [Rickettsiales bacterium]